MYNETIPSVLPARDLPDRSERQSRGSPILKVVFWAVVVTLAVLVLVR